MIFEPYAANILNKMKEKKKETKNIGSSIICLVIFGYPFGLRYCPFEF